MMKFRCTMCELIYDPAEGDAERDIPPGTPFQDVLDDWSCPGCGASKSEFVPIFADEGAPYAS